MATRIQRMATEALEELRGQAEEREDFDMVEEIETELGRREGN